MFQCTQLLLTKLNITCKNKSGLLTLWLQINFICIPFQYFDQAKMRPLMKILPRLRGFLFAMLSEDNINNNSPINNTANFNNQFLSLKEIILQVRKATGLTLSWNIWMLFEGDVRNTIKINTHYLPLRLQNPFYPFWSFDNLCRYYMHVPFELNHTVRLKNRRANQIFRETFHVHTEICLLRTWLWKSTPDYNICDWIFDIFIYQSISPS